MSIRESYLPGTPCWVDIGSPNLEVTHAFYTSLLGWTTTEAGPVEETGGYGFYLLGDKIAAGFGPAQAEGVWWTTYVSVADADATCQAVTQAGGTVIMPAMDVMDAGRMAVLADPTGAALSIWQPGGHIGSQIVNEPGALCWNELMSRDLANAIPFYETVFGWVAQGGPDAEYTEWHLGENVVGGAMPMPEMVPAEVPSYWNAYFAVADVDASAAKATELGGNVLFPPMQAGDTGRFTSVIGPLGEAFGLIQLNQPS